MIESAHILEPMTYHDIDEAVALITRAMNPSEGQWARYTMTAHFQCASHGIDDGRSYFVWRLSGKIVGLVGLHHYLWGPQRNVWLSWFAVDPALQRQGHGRALLKAIEQLALQKGYQKFLVETYNHPDFDKARSFYLSQGFTLVGSIADYLEDGADMIVFAKGL